MGEMAVLSLFVFQQQNLGNDRACLQSNISIKNISMKRKIDLMHQKRLEEVVRCKEDSSSLLLLLSKHKPATFHGGVCVLRPVLFAKSSTESLSVKVLTHALFALIRLRFLSITTEQSPEMTQRQRNNPEEVEVPHA
jgi:hypothetical protein